MSYSVYIAAARLDMDRARELARFLDFLGVGVTSTWHAEVDVGMDDAPLDVRAAKRLANLCVDEIKEAGAVLVVRPSVGGTGVWVEFGMARAMNKKLWLIDGAQLIAGEARVVTRRTIFEELDGVIPVLDDQHLGRLVAVERDA